MANKGSRNSPVIGNNRFDLQKGDSSRYLRHVLGNRGLEPIDISDPKQVEDRITWYFNRCIEDDIQPAVTGLANALGVHRDTINGWKNGSRRPETHKDIIQEAYNVMMELWEINLRDGKYNPVAGIYLGKVLFGFVDEQNITVQAKPLEQETKDISVIEAKYKELPDD